MCVYCRLTLATASQMTWCSRTHRRLRLPPKRYVSSGLHMRVCVLVICCRSFRHSRPQANLNPPAHAKASRRRKTKNKRYDVVWWIYVYIVLTISMYACMFVWVCVFVGAGGHCAASGLLHGARFAASVASRCRTAQHQCCSSVRLVAIHFLLFLSFFLSLVLFHFLHLIAFFTTQCTHQTSD